MKPVVLVGHLHECPLHGVGVVETGSETYQWRQPMLPLGVQCAVTHLNSASKRRYNGAQLTEF